MSRSKYVDQTGTKISKKDYEMLLSMGESYSVMLRSTIVSKLRDAECRVEILWVGEHDKDCPDEYVTPFEIRLSNYSQISEKWVIEPIVGFKSKFTSFGQAKIAFNTFVELTFKHSDWNLTSTTLTSSDESQSDSDIDDYGEPVVPKDVPRTKSLKTGSW